MMPPHTARGGAGSRRDRRYGHLNERKSRLEVLSSILDVYKNQVRRTFVVISLCLKAGKTAGVTVKLRTLSEKHNFIIELGIEG